MQFRWSDRGFHPECGDRKCKIDEEVRFPDSARECWTDVRALAYETGHAVVVGGTAREDTGGREACRQKGIAVPGEVTLADPLGLRVLLDALTGIPVVLLVS